jgi:integrase
MYLTGKDYGKDKGAKGTMPRKRISSRGNGRVFQPKYTHNGRRVVSKLWWLDYSLDGRRHRESAETDDRSVALERLRQKLSGAHNGEEWSETSATFDDLEKRIIENYTKKNRNLRVLKVCRLPPLRRHLGNMQARDIDEARINRYASERKNEKKMIGGKLKIRSKNCVSGPTVNRELTTLRRMLNLAYEARMIKRVPVFEMFGESPARKGFVDKHHVEKMQQYCPTETYENLLDIMFITGWRASSELMTRKWDDVDFAGGELRLWVGEGKDRKVGRVFKLLPSLREAFERQRNYVRKIELRERKVIPWVFVKPNGDHLRAPRNGLASIFAKAGLPGLLPHDFRRSAVRNLNKARVDRHTAKALVGHKTDSMYARYSIVDEEMMDTAAAQLETFLKAQPKSEKKRKVG